MSAFGKDQREARLQRLELHALESMQVVLRTLFGCHYMPAPVRDVVTMCCVWGASIGQDARVIAEDPEPPPPPPGDPEVIELLWDDEPTQPMPTQKVTKP